MDGRKMFVRSRRHPPIFLPSIFLPAPLSVSPLLGVSASFSAPANHTGPAACTAACTCSVSPASAETRGTGKTRRPEPPSLGSRSTREASGRYRRYVSGTGRNCWKLPRNWPCSVWYSCRGGLQQHVGQMGLSLALHIGNLRQLLPPSDQQIGLLLAGWRLV